MKTTEREKNKVIDSVRIRIDPKKAPKPAYLATIILQNNGYIFGGVPEEQKDNTDYCDVYNGDRCVGRIMYAHIGDEVYATIEAFMTMTEDSGGTLASFAKRLR